MKKILYLFILTQSAIAQKMPDNIFPETTGDDSPIPDVIKTEGTLLSIFDPIANLLLQMVAPVALIMIVYSGVLYIKSAGNDEDLQKAKGFFLYSLLGIIITMAAYSIIKFSIYILTKA